MPTLYNCKHSGDQYRITKFTSNFEVEASYLCDLHSCECPAGHRPKCRHREMLPKFIQREHIGDNWFLDFDRGGWVQGWKEEPALDIQQYDASTDTINRLSEQELVSAALSIQPSTEPSPEPELSGLQEEQILMGFHQPELCDSLAPAGPGQASEQTPSTYSCVDAPSSVELRKGLEYPQATPSPLRFNKDYSNSIGYSPAHDVLRPSPSPTIRRRV